VSGIADETSLVGLAFQCVGSILVASLFFLLTSTVRRPFFDAWARAWLALAASLCALLIAFCLGAVAAVFFRLYLVGGYSFGYFLLHGCRLFSVNTGLEKWRRTWFGCAIILALVLPFFASNFNQLFAFHSAVVAAVYGAGWWIVFQGRKRWPDATGPGIMLFALGCLALSFLSYVPLFADVAVHPPRAVLYPHLKYCSLIDLVLQMLLAFGTVILVMENIRAEVELANHELNRASIRLQALAKRDPLTESLNRHAFDSILRHSEERSSLNKVFSGTVALLDLDDLKRINDTYGHPAGDAAIRALATAIRGVVRADDLLFRWGGDEFVVILHGVSPADTRTRLERMQAALRKSVLPGAAEPVELQVSFGAAAFERPSGLEDAIGKADMEMYTVKHAKKAGRSQQIEILP
jgi:diguanylate cyclase